MKIGYARVSSNSQDLEIQKEALSKYGCTDIYSESQSGKNNEKAELKKALNALRKGDVNL